MKNSIILTMLQLVHTVLSDSATSYLEPVDANFVTRHSISSAISSARKSEQAANDIISKSLSNLPEHQFSNPETGSENGRFLKFSTTENPHTAFLQRRIFNTSIALTVPMFSFVLPNKAQPGEGSVVDLANQAIFGLFSLLSLVIVFAAPVMFNGLRPGGGRSYDDNTSLNSLMHSNRVYNFMSHGIGNQVGLDREKCLQNIICEAQQNPEKYGLVALPFVIFFPPPSEGRRATSPYQAAAQDGKSHNVNCRKKFNCFFDFLELAVYFVDMWKYSNENKDVVFL